MPNYRYTAGVSFTGQTVGKLLSCPEKGLPGVPSPSSPASSVGPASHLAHAIFCHPKGRQRSVLGLSVFSTEYIAAGVFTVRARMKSGRTSKCRAGAQDNMSESCVHTVTWQHLPMPECPSSVACVSENVRRSRRLRFAICSLSSVIA